MDLHPTKLEEMARVSLRNTLRGNPKNVRQSKTNSVFFSTNNEKQAIQAKQDRLKRERYRTEHKAPKHYVEVAISDSTGHRNPISL